MADGVFDALMAGSEAVCGATSAAAASLVARSRCRLQVGCDGERRAVGTARSRGMLDGGAGMVPASRLATMPAARYAAASMRRPARSILCSHGLAAAETRRSERAASLMLLFGDSHTAGDAMTSRLRSRCSTKFGDAGRGLVAAGKPPAKHYYQRDVRYGASGTWTAAVGGKRGDSEPFGIGGLRVSGTSARARSCGSRRAAIARRERAIAQFEMLYYAAPDHGVLRYRVDDGAWQQLATEDRARSSRRIRRAR